MRRRVLFLHRLRRVYRLFVVVETVEGKLLRGRNATNPKINFGDNPVHAVGADKQAGQVGTVGVTLEVQMTGSLVRAAAGVQNRAIG